MERFLTANSKRHARSFLKSVVAVPLDELFQPAMAIARQIAVGFYDCLYLAAAEKLDCRLVTADNKLLGAGAESHWSARLVSLKILAAEHG